MKVPPPSLIARPAGYAEWLAVVKARVHAAQQRAAFAVNHEMLRLHWEYVGQLGFYLTAVDAQVKAPEDAPTIGLLLCKSKNQIIAEYALRDSRRPIGVAEYQLVEALPKDLEASLPSVEMIERELGEMDDG